MLKRFSRDQNIWLFFEVFISPLSAAAGLIILTIIGIGFGMNNWASMIGFPAWAGYLALAIGWWVLFLHAMIQWREFKLQQQIREADNED